jgi:hypothetical protein
LKRGRRVFSSSLNAYYAALPGTLRIYNTTVTRPFASVRSRTSFSPSRRLILPFFFSSVFFAPCRLLSSSPSRRDYHEMVDPPRGNYAMRFLSMLKKVDAKTACQATENSITFHFLSSFLPFFLSSFLPFFLSSFLPFFLSSFLSFFLYLPHHSPSPSPSPFILRRQSSLDLFSHFRQ